MILGCYYLTRLTEMVEKGEGSFIGSYDEARLSYINETITLHAKINFKDSDGTWIESTSIGRVLFNEILPEKIRFINSIISKKQLNTIISKSYKECGNMDTVSFLDKLKDLGFEFAFKKWFINCIR